MKGMVQLSSVPKDISYLQYICEFRGMVLGDGEKGGEQTIFNTILQFQRLPRLITHRKRYILQLILLILYMLPRITIASTFISISFILCVSSPNPQLLTPNF
jgi:hypothetical protein